MNLINTLINRWFQLWDIVEVPALCLIPAFAALNIGQQTNFLNLDTTTIAVLWICIAACRLLANIVFRKNIKGPWLPYGPFGQEKKK